MLPYGLRGRNDRKESSSGSATAAPLRLLGPWRTGTSLSAKGSAGGCKQFPILCLTKGNHANKESTKSFALKGSRSPAFSPTPT